MINRTREKTNPVKVTIPPPIAASRVTADDGDNRVNSAAESANASSAAWTRDSTTTATTTPVSGMTQNASSHHVRSRMTFLPTITPCRSLRVFHGCVVAIPAHPDDRRPSVPYCLEVSAHHYRSQLGRLPTTTTWNGFDACNG